MTDTHLLHGNYGNTRLLRKHTVTSSLAALPQALTLFFAFASLYLIGMMSPVGKEAGSACLFPCRLRLMESRNRWWLADQARRSFGEMHVVSPVPAMRGRPGFGRGGLQPSGGHPIPNIVRKSGVSILVSGPPCEKADRKTY